MTTKISYIEKWLRDYTSGFYCGDKKIDTSVKLKTIHTFLVAKEMATLADKLNLLPEQKDIAILTGLLHDCGRFEQISKYRTFDDSKSENHALLAIKIIEENRLIDDLTPQQQTIIKDAIKNHNALNIELLPDAPNDTLLMAKMIRDADKLDIFRVVKNIYEEYIKSPETANISAISFGEDTGEATPEVIQCVLECKQVDYKDLKTLDDRKLLQLSWIFDINFSQVLEEIISRGYLDMIFSSLPKTSDMKKIKLVVKQYINKTLPD